MPAPLPAPLPPTAAQPAVAQPNAAQLGKVLVQLREAGDVLRWTIGRDVGATWARRAVGATWARRSATELRL